LSEPRLPNDKPANRSHLKHWYRIEHRAEWFFARFMSHDSLADDRSHRAAEQCDKQKRSSGYPPEPILSSMFVVIEENECSEVHNEQQNSTKQCDDQACFHFALSNRIRTIARRPLTQGFEKKSIIVKV
jgi:hypothetical protein